MQDPPASGLRAELEQAQKDLDAALRNSFDTPAALQVILRVVRSANVAMGDASADLAAVEAVARWVTKLVGIFGLDPNARPPYEASVGWGPANPTTAAAVDPQVAVQPYAAAYARVQADVAALLPTLAAPQQASVQALLASQTPDAEVPAALDVEQLALPYLRAVSALRDELRRAATAADINKTAKGQILALSDRSATTTSWSWACSWTTRPTGRA